MWGMTIGSQGGPKEGHQTVEPEEEWSRTLNRLIRPLPLGLDPPLGAAFLKGGFQTPALHKITHDFFSRLRLVGGKERFGWARARGVASEDPPNR